MCQWSPGRCGLPGSHPPLHCRGDRTTAGNAACCSRLTFWPPLFSVYPPPGDLCQPQALQNGLQAWSLRAHAPADRSSASALPRPTCAPVRKDRRVASRAEHTSLRLPCLAARQWLVRCSVACRKAAALVPTDGCRDEAGCPPGVAKVGRALRIAQFLLRLYPRAFRARYEHEMCLNSAPRGRRPG